MDETTQQNDWNAGLDRFRLPQQPRQVTIVPQFNLDLVSWIMEDLRRHNTQPVNNNDDQLPDK